MTRIIRTLLIVIMMVASNVVAIANNLIANSKYLVSNWQK